MQSEALTQSLGGSRHLRMHLPRRCSTTSSSSIGSSSRLQAQPMPPAVRPCSNISSHSSSKGWGQSRTSSAASSSWRAPPRSSRLVRLPPAQSAADAGALGGGDTAGAGDAASADPPYEYKPFARLRERNPHRLLGVSKEASFEEIQDARNYLFEQYKWHEPSREAIEMAFDKLLQVHMKDRFKFGFRPPRFGRGGGAFAGSRNTLLDRFMSLFDPTVTTRTIINEGAVFGAFALWVLFSSDQSFPLAGAFAYSVYQFQSKRVKRDPEGPFLGGNAIVGAILSTLACLAVACGVMAVLTTPLTAVLGQSTRQVGGFITIAVMGAVGIYLK